MSELRQRPGDQRLPIKNALPSMHDKAVGAMQSRRELGVKRYGQPLQPANGRDAALDAWEEALDGAAYGAQVVWEQQNPRETYVGAIIRALSDLHSDDVENVVIEFGEQFVPQGVLDMLDSEYIDYTRSV